MSFWLSHIFCLEQIWFYLVFIFSEFKNIMVFVRDFRLLSGCLVSWLIFCCYLLQTFFVCVFLLKKFREESRRSLSSRIWGRSRFIRAHTCIVQHLPPQLLLIHDGLHDHRRSHLLHPLLCHVYMDAVAAVSVLRHGGTGPVLEHRHGAPLTSPGCGGHMGQGSIENQAWQDFYDYSTFRAYMWQVGVNLKR